ncbi:site-specific integrase [Bacteroides nordii]|uniref:site-specific integrase n=1 Tax=Bacteroides nordii TaxID=291645 RepID=UPI003522C1FC
MKHTFIINFYLKRSVIRKNGKMPVVMRIIINGERTDVHLPIDVCSSMWSVEFGRASGKTDEARQVNAFLEQVHATLFTYYRQSLVEGIIVTAKGLKQRFVRLGVQPQTLLSIFRKHNDDAYLMAKSEGISMSTYKKYDLAFRRIEQFIVKQGKTDIQLCHLDMCFINDYELFLRTDCNLGINMAAKMLQILKKVVLLARNLGIINFNPFLNHHTKREEIGIRYLTWSELERIKQKEITIPRLAFVRDLFVFSSYTGLSYADIRKLSECHISSFKNGSLWIMQNRTKTGHLARIPLLPSAVEILNRYRKTDCELIFAVMSNQKLNSYLKELADICKIKKVLTFHVARHTFSTTICLDNGLPIETLSKMLGHSDIKITQAYAKVSNRKIEEDVNKLNSILQ